MRGVIINVIRGDDVVTNTEAVGSRGAVRVRAKNPSSAVEKVDGATCLPANCDDTMFMRIAIGGRRSGIEQFSRRHA